MGNYLYVFLVPHSLNFGASLQEYAFTTSHAIRSTLGWAAKNIYSRI